MLLVIFPMFTFPKKLPPRHKKKKKRRKKLSLDNMSSDDDVLKEKSNNGKSQAVSSSMGFGKDIKGRVLPAQCPLDTQFSIQNVINSKIKVCENKR